MRKLLFLLLLIPALCSGQGRTTFGASRTTDTSYTPAQMRVVGGVRLDNYATSDTTKVLATDATGKVVLRTVPGGGSSTVEMLTATGNNSASMTFSQISGKRVYILSMQGQSYNSDWFTQVGTTLTLGIGAFIGDVTLIYK